MAPAAHVHTMGTSLWIARGEAGDRQVEGAKVGVTANKGLFGHGSSVLLST